MDEGPLYPRKARASKCGRKYRPPSGPSCKPFSWSGCITYHGLMTKTRIASVSLVGGAWLWAAVALAQSPAPGVLPPAIDAAESATAPDASRLDSELFYQLLVGEMTAQDGDASAGFTLLLDAARKTNDAQLYQRATEIALQSRSGDDALQAAQAWKQAQPASRDANRFVLQILIALNRLGDTLLPLQRGVELAAPADRALAIAAIPRAYARATDKALATSTVQTALVPYLKDPATAGSAWTTVGRMRLSAGDGPGALGAAQSGMAADPRYEGPVLLALEIMEPRLPAAEDLVKRHLASTPAAAPEIRMGYARALLDAQRYGEASEQLRAILAQKPDFAPAWLVLGTLQLQDNQLPQAQSSLEKFIALPQPAGTEDEPSRAMTQAFLQLAQIAEKRKNFAVAESWLAKIENSDDLIQAQSRRASILATQGKLSEGRELIRKLPERREGDARLKLAAEVALLRDVKQYQAAYELLGQAVQKSPDDADLVYDQAMVAEKLDKLPDMERLLKKSISLKPDSPTAYNALGYSFAERNIRLAEARELIQKALQYTPSDPFIQDSLGWVEFRLGNKDEAVRIFTTAFRAKPDAEIAAHFGEVLWSMGQREKALAIWREGQLLNAENETLVATLKRLGAKP
jgi:tetratricopeptide (TPR) repeat protein